MTELNPVEGPTLLHTDGVYGNAVLTSLPVPSVRRYDISTPGVEPRGKFRAHRSQLNRIASDHQSIHTPVEIS